MAAEEYSVVYVVRSPATMRQEEYAPLVQDECNKWAGEGWRLLNAVGDYGQRVTLGTWLYFVKEG